MKMEGSNMLREHTTEIEVHANTDRTQERELERRENGTRLKYRTRKNICCSKESGPFRQKTGQTGCEFVSRKRQNHHPF